MVSGVLSGKTTSVRSPSCSELRRKTPPPSVLATQTISGAPVTVVAVAAGPAVGEGVVGGGRAVAVAGDGLETTDAGEVAGEGLWATVATGFGVATAGAGVGWVEL